eukprot:6482911-Amphidinium_carterae.1
MARVAGRKKDTRKVLKAFTTLREVTLVFPPGATCATCSMATVRALTPASVFTSTGTGIQRSSRLDCCSAQVLEDGRQQSGLQKPWCSVPMCMWSHAPSLVSALGLQRLRTRLMVCGLTPRSKAWRLSQEMKNRGTSSS